MITASGYSKDPGIIPEGIVVTFGQDMIKEKGGLKEFLYWLETCLRDETSFFLHKCRLKPIHEIDHVYIVIANRLYGRAYFGGWATGPTLVFTHPGAAKTVEITWPRLYLAGPIERAPFKRTLRGFRGFRYCTKLF
jgi:hypothetical protein